MNELIFVDQSKDVSDRVGHSGPSSSSASRVSPPRHTTGDRDALAQRCFVEHCIAPVSLSYLEGKELDGYLRDPILACGYAVLSNRDNDDATGHKLARMHYVDAIAATTEAIQHPERVTLESTMIAVVLLGLFEYLTWDGDGPFRRWTQHVKGLATILQLRGLFDLSKRENTVLFRDLRSYMVEAAIPNEAPIPEVVEQWTQTLGYDPEHSSGDSLFVLASQLSTLRIQFKNGDASDEQLVQGCAGLETALKAWAETNLREGGAYTFQVVTDVESAQSWHGARHEYRSPNARHYWNTWRCYRILLSRMQEALWRRSWPLLSRPSQPIQDSEEHRFLRTHVAEDICRATADIFGVCAGAEPVMPKGSVVYGHKLVRPLALAGTVLLEQRMSPSITPDGNRVLAVRGPHHLDQFNQTSTQLAWIIDRLDFIADKVGIRWAGAMSRFLKGETGDGVFDLGRS